MDRSARSGAIALVTHLNTYLRKTRPPAFAAPANLRQVATALPRAPRISFRSQGLAARTMAGAAGGCDPCADIEETVGFKRPDMFQEYKHFAIKPYDGHLMVISDTTAAEWPSDAFSIGGTARCPLSARSTPPPPAPPALSSAQPAPEPEPAAGCEPGRPKPRGAAGPSGALNTAVKDAKDAIKCSLKVPARRPRACGARRPAGAGGGGSPRRSPPAAGLCVRGGAVRGRRRGRRALLPPRVARRVRPAAPSPALPPPARARPPIRSLRLPCTSSSPRPRERRAAALSAGPGGVRPAAAPGATARRRRTRRRRPSSWPRYGAMTPARAPARARQGGSGRPRCVRDRSKSRAGGQTAAVKPRGGQAGARGGRPRRAPEHGARRPGAAPPPRRPGLRHEPWSRLCRRRSPLRHES
jgi:hypothetical protein